MSLQQTVLEGFTDIDSIDVSLPKRTMAANMLDEGRILAQCQVAQKVAEKDLTVCTDGTSKFGHHTWHTTCIQNRERVIC